MSVSLVLGLSILTIKPLHIRSVTNKIFYYHFLLKSRVGLDSDGFLHCYLCLRIFWVGPVYYSQDPQVSFSINIISNLGLMTLCTYLKIILIQYFQFSVINDIQIYSNGFNGFNDKLCTWK